MYIIIIIILFGWGKNKINYIASAVTRVIFFFFFLVNHKLSIIKKSINIIKIWRKSLYHSFEEPRGGEFFGSSANITVSKEISHVRYGLFNK